MAIILAITIIASTVTAYSEPLPTTIFVTNQSVTKPSVPEYNIQVSKTSNQTILLNFKIKNEAFTSYEHKDPNNHLHIIEYYYNIHFKVLHAQNDQWFDPYDLNHGYIERILGNITSYVVHGQNLPEMGYDFKEWNSLIPKNASMEIQLQGMIGYYNSTHFIGQISDWSNSLTVDLNQMTVVTPNPSPTVPEFSWLIILPLTLSTLLIGFIVRRKKTS
ncbi:MAG: hypothetical protein M1540_01975 [Candidatus Bathyarchaeota archaeon]|nr:hypothetical protein [Candidatus Bathyarchaeota archaeon]